MFMDYDNDGDEDLYVVSGSVECEPGAAVLVDRLYLNAQWLHGFATERQAEKIVSGMKTWIGP